MSGTLLTLVNYRRLVEAALLDVLRLALLRRETAADLAALAALDVTRYGDGALVYVTADARVWRLALYSGAAAGAGVVVPATLPQRTPRARWLRVTSAATYGPNWRAPLHAVGQGPLRAVEIYSGDEGPAAGLARVMGAMPSMMIDIDTETRQPLSAGYQGSLYRVELGYSLMLFTASLRGAGPVPESTHGSAAEPGELGPHDLAGQISLVLAGLAGADVGLQGLDRVEIGSVTLAQEDEAERRFVHAIEIRCLCFARNPDLDLDALVIDAQPELADSPPAAPWDPLYFVAQGYYLTPAPGLTVTLAAGVAVVGGATVASAPAPQTLDADRDTYADLGADGAVTWTAVSLDHAVPELAAGALRLGVARTDAAGVTRWTPLCSVAQTFRSAYQIAP